MSNPIISSDTPQAIQKNVCENDHYTTLHAKFNVNFTDLYVMVVALLLIREAS